MSVIEKFSPNFDSRSAHVIDMLVLHYTGMPTAGAALKRMCDPDAKVSAHYMVDEDGTIYSLVAENARAWHAGLSFWRGETNINQRAIGIEIVNPGHEFGYRAFPPAQMKAVALLCRDILARNIDITPRNVVAHSDIAPARKEDPGELFDWKTLAKLGIGLHPLCHPEHSEGSSAAKKGDPSPAAQDDIIKPEKLADYGYDITDLPKAITAFKRHFRQNSITGQWDSECGKLLAALLALV